MPHLTLQITPGGPLLNLLVGVSEPRRLAMSLANQTPPPPVRICGLIDTGASGTCIDPSSITSLGLVPTGQTTVHTPTTGSNPVICNQFDVQLFFFHPNGNHLRIPALPIICSDLQQQGIQALIGRDVLSQCLFVYDGASRIFSLAF